MTKIIHCFVFILISFHDVNSKDSLNLKDIEIGLKTELQVSDEANSIISFEKLPTDLQNLIFIYAKESLGKLICSSKQLLNNSKNYQIDYMLTCLNYRLESDQFKYFWIDKALKILGYYEQLDKSFDDLGVVNLNYRNKLKKFLSGPKGIFFSNDFKKVNGLERARILAQKYNIVEQFNYEQQF